MTRDSLLALLREIEWEGGLPEPWCEGVNPCCPSCVNEAGPHHLRAHAQHEKGCKLAEAIAWLEDDDNRKPNDSGKWVIELDARQAGD